MKTQMDYIAEKKTHKNFTKGDLLIIVKENNAHGGKIAIALSDSRFIEDQWSYDTDHMRETCDILLDGKEYTNVSVKWMDRLA